MDHRALIAEAHLCDLRRRLSQIAGELSAMRPAYDFESSMALMLAESELRSVIARGKPYAPPTPIALWPIDGAPRKV
jgi:hypothetical protein